MGRLAPDDLRFEADGSAGAVICGNGGKSTCGSYYVQQMFSVNRGDVVLPMEVDSPTVSSGPKGGAIGVGIWLTQAEFKDIKVTRGDETLFASDFAAHGTEGWKLLSGDWNVQGRSGEGHRVDAGDPTDENSLENPTNVAPVTKQVRVNGTTIRYVCPGNSLTVLRVKAE